jgi:hypothetical protein
MVQLILTVVDYDDGNPIAGAVVTVYEPTVATDGVTNDDGLVVFSVSSGQPTISVQKAGYDTVTLQLDTTFSDPTTYTILLPKTNGGGFPWWLLVAATLVGVALIAESGKKKKGG